MDVLELIDELHDLVHSAKHVPLRDQVRVDEAKLYDVLDPRVVPAFRISTASAPSTSSSPAYHSPARIQVASRRFDVARDHALLAAGPLAHGRLPRAQSSCTRPVKLVASAGRCRA
jgi:hypothetical protein